MLHLPRKVLGGHPSPRRQSFRPTVGGSLRAYERAYNEYLLFPFPGNPRRIVTVVIVTANTIEVKACEQPLTTLFTENPRETVWKLLRTDQPPHHKPRHRRVDERLPGGTQPLVVLRHSTVVRDPRKGALHHPPTR